MDSFRKGGSEQGAPATALPQDTQKDKESRPRVLPRQCADFKVYPMEPARGRPDRPSLIQVKVIFGGCALSALGCDGPPRRMSCSKFTVTY